METQTVLPTSTRPIQPLLRDFKNQIKAVCRERLAHILLYGSWARGEATDHSDIDLLIALNGVVQPGQEIDRLIDIVTDLNLKYSAPISIYPISVAHHTTVNSPLLLNARREGMMV